MIFVTLLSISTSWAIKAKKEELKDKREAASGSYLPPHGSSSHSYQGPALSQEDANAISIGAGYSIGGAKPSYNFLSQGPGQPSYQVQSEGLPASGHGTIQLAPITLQPSQPGLISNDLSQLMSQLSHGINSGAIAIPSSGQGAIYQFAGQSGHSGQDLSAPQFSYGSPKLQQYSFGEQSSQAGQIVPAYAFGAKGLSSYGSTGPVLFSPESTASQPALNYAVPASGHSYEGAALPLGDSGHSYAGLSLGGSGQSSLGGSLKSLGGYVAPGKSSQFKPSTFLGASAQSEASHNLLGHSNSYGSPSFAAYQSAGGHGGASLGSSGHAYSFPSLSGLSAAGSPSKQVASAYLPPKEGFGSFESIASAFSASGQMALPGTTYGSPSASYSASNIHAASAPSPAYYVSSSKHSAPSFGSGSSSYRGPLSSHSSFSSGHSSIPSGPKYSFGGHSNSRFAPPKDAQGSYSESSYNTIKYSEELKPRFN